MPYPIRCPDCRAVFRVPAFAVGTAVPCPSCAGVVRAVPEAKVRSAQPSHEGTGHGVESPPSTPTAFLLGLALLPFGLPFLWLFAPFVLKVESIFSVFVPLALAIATAGLALGVAFTRDWSAGTRVKAILALLFLAYGTGGFLYFVRKDWVEVLRKQLGRGDLEWRDFKAPDKSFHVRMPGRAEAAESPFADWALQAFRVLEKNSEGAKDMFLVAYGQVPKDFQGLGDDNFFDKVKALVAPENGGTLTSEKAIRHQNIYPGREYALVLPDGGTNRIVRVYWNRNENWVYLLVVEGAFLPPTHGDVKTFFESFFVDLRK